MARKKKTPLTTYIAIILDKSGSMARAREITVRSFNEQVQTIKANCTKKMTTLVSLFTFNYAVTTVFENKPANEVQELSLEDYQPFAGTAMLDAVSFAIDSLLKVPDADTASFLLVVISDGEENCSRASYADVAEKIQQVQGTGRWTVTYLGANQDLSKLEKDLGLKAGNIATFSTKTAADYGIGISLSTMATGEFLRSRSVGLASTGDFYSNKPNGN